MMYKVQIGDATVTVTVIETNSQLLDRKLAELNSSLHLRVVAVELFLFETHSDAAGDENLNFRWLLISAGNHCLMIDLDSLSPLPESLVRFFEDKTICFVGLRTKQSMVQRAMKEKGLSCETLVSLGDLAARVLKKPGLDSVSEIGRLGCEVGIGDVRPPVCEFGKSCFQFSEASITKMQIPCVVYEVFRCSLVATSLLGNL